MIRDLPCVLGVCKFTTIVILVGDCIVILYIRAPNPYLWENHRIFVKYRLQHFPKLEMDGYDRSFLDRCEILDPAFRTLLLNYLQSLRTHTYMFTKAAEVSDVFFFFFLKRERERERVEIFIKF